MMAAPPGAKTVLGRVMVNKWSTLLVVPAQMARDLGIRKGEHMQVYIKAGVLCYERVRLTGVKWRKPRNDD
jgi:hypothetical protein